MASPEEILYGTLEPVGGGDPIPLLKERLVIGRRETCDICLRFENVSTQHCELILEQGYWKVKDLQSTNGVKVNDERVLEKRIYPGDELSISKHRYRLDYVPMTARSADAEVDDLHEDIMQFSLLERAGLTKQGDPTRQAARRPRSAEDATMARILKGERPRRSQTDADQVEIPETGTKAVEEEVQAVTPAKSAHNLSDDDFLRMIEEEKQEQNKEEGKTTPPTSREQNKSE